MHRTKVQSGWPKRRASGHMMRVNSSPVYTWGDAFTICRKWCMTDDPYWVVWIKRWGLLKQHKPMAMLKGTFNSWTQPVKHWRGRVIQLYTMRDECRTFWRRDISGGPGRPSGWGLRQAWMTARTLDQPNENQNERGLCRGWPNKLAPEFREGMLVDPAHQVSVVTPCCSRVSTVPSEQGWFYTRECEMSRIQVRLQAAGIRVHYGLVIYQELLSSGTWRYARLNLWSHFDFLDGERNLKCKYWIMLKQVLIETCIFNTK